MMELTEIMRQKDDIDFANLLNRFREGNHTREDIAQLHTRDIPRDVKHGQLLSTGDTYDIFSTHLFFLNKAVENHNTTVFNELASTDEQRVRAIDKFTSSLNPALKDQHQTELETRSAKDTGDLFTTLAVFIYSGRIPGFPPEAWKICPLLVTWCR